MMHGHKNIKLLANCAVQSVDHRPFVTGPPRFL